MKNVVLFGNGFNRLNGGISWGELLKKITTEPLIANISNTLQYEAIILSSDYYNYEPLVTSDGYQIITADQKQLNVIDKPVEEIIKNRIKDELERFIPNRIYQRISQLDIEHYITTNYDHTLYKQLYELEFKESNSNNTEKLYSIRRKFSLKNKDGKEKYIWPMHGTIQYPKSIMLGLDHYCGSIGKIDNYIKGNYEYGKDVKLEGLIKRLKNNKCDPPLSWIDLFFTHNIHIIGLGLYQDEIDLWWILNKRKRYIRQYGNEVGINNKIYYYGDVEDNMRQLLNRLGVEVRQAPPSCQTSYEKQYDHFIDEIESHTIDE